MTRYRTIVADPPWPHNDGFFSHGNRRAQGVHKLPYGSMTLDDIRGLPVADLVDSGGARLFMWTTNRFLPDSFSVLSAWGFVYKQTLVWHKTGNPSPFGGSVAPIHAEFLLVAVRGDVPIITRMKSSVIDAAKPIRDHSMKPEGFLDRIEAVSPAPYIELFSRRARLGWDTWGDQALHGTAAVA